MVRIFLVITNIWQEKCSKNSEEPRALTLDIARIFDWGGAQTTNHLQ